MDQFSSCAWHLANQIVELKENLAVMRTQRDAYKATVASLRSENADRAEAAACESVGFKAAAVEKDNQLAKLAARLLRTIEKGGRKARELASLKDKHV